MPNNPGRIDGDYSIGEKEEIKYADPPKDMGGLRKENPQINRAYIMTAAIIVVFVILYFLYSMFYK